MTVMVDRQSVTLGAGWWARGLNLAERGNAGTAEAVPDDGRQQRRLARWRTAHGMEAELFGRRLADAGLSEDGLSALLGEAPDAVAARLGKPVWAGEVEAVLAELDAAGPHPLAPASNGNSAGFTGLATVVAPFARHAMARLTATPPTPAGSARVDHAALRTELGDRLLRTLVQLATRTLVLELNVLQVTDRLTGDTPADRFASFVRHYGDPAHLCELFDEYPALARLLAQAATAAADGHRELLDRFAADRATLVTDLFGGIDPGTLVSVTTSGDGHRGRAVAVLRFAHGARVVSKPRPLAVHRHFNDAVGWLNRRLPGLDLRRLRVVDRGGYGWLEYARYAPCRDTAAVGRYYRRQGALLALLYVLDGADFHFENLIACGDQPVLVDLEALFHPQVRQAGPDWLAGDPALRTLTASVDRVGLLPRLTIGRDETAAELEPRLAELGLKVTERV